VRDNAFAILIFLYTIARIMLIVEVFRSLLFLPVDTYLTPKWSMDIPYIGQWTCRLQ
jgi:hypothetical protein